MTKTEKQQYEETMSKMAVPTTTVFCALFDEIEAIRADNEAKGTHLTTDEILWQMINSKNKETANDTNRETRAGSILASAQN